MFGKRLTTNKKTKNICNRFLFFVFEEHLITYIHTHPFSDTTQGTEHEWGTPKPATAHI